MTDQPPPSVVAVEAIDGPVDADHPSHLLRYDAALDWIARAERQLAKAKSQAVLYPDKVGRAAEFLADAQAHYADVLAERERLGLPTTPDAVAEAELAAAQRRLAAAQERVAAVKES